MKEEKQRTLLQNRSLHLWMEMLATELNDSGLTIEKTLTGRAEIPWSKETIKEILFRQVMKAQTGKESTTELTTKELSGVCETLTRHLAEQHGLVVDFPSLETMMMEQRVNSKHQRLKRSLINQNFQIKTQSIM